MLMLFITHKIATSKIKKDLFNENIIAIVPSYNYKKCTKKIRKVKIIHIDSPNLYKQLIGRTYRNHIEYECENRKR